MPRLQPRPRFTTRRSTAPLNSTEALRRADRRPGTAGRAPCTFSSRIAPKRKGTAAVEFAFVAPVFFLLVFGMIEFSRMVMIQQSLTNAAREGCRMAALATTMSSSAVESAVRSHLNTSMSNASDAQEVRVTVPTGMSAASSGSDLAVQVEVDYADVSWLPVEILGLNPTLRAKQIGKRE